MTFKRNLNLLTSFLILSTLFSCINESKDKLSHTVHEALKGHWQSTKDGYTELQISDSLYYFIKFDGYAGPVKPIPYAIVNDSLLWLDESGRIRQGFKIIQCDFETLVLEDDLNRRVYWKKFNPKMEIKNWKEEIDSSYNLEFLKRKYDDK